MKAKPRLPRQGRSLLEAIRQFLTPAVWKQAHRFLPSRKKRWELQPLVLTLLCMTWCCGDSMPERFETAKAFCIVCRPKRQRPGAGITGFQKALGKLPPSVLRALAAALRKVFLPLFAAGWQTHGFVPLGVDGSRLECPRTKELERYVGCSGKKDSAPNLWLTAIVHLRLGLLWSWRLGTSHGSERDHLRRLIPTLPNKALVVADAGFDGYDVFTDLEQAGVKFLIRMSSKVTLQVLAPLPKGWWDRDVYYWPKKAERKERPALPCRLMRIRSRKRGHDVYLLTNVMDRRQLPLDVAAMFYRWRWENEGLFRTYKRTLAKVKLMSRTFQLVHREAEGSLLALQLLLALGARSVQPSWSAAGQTKSGKQKTKPASTLLPEGCSPRKVLLAIRDELYVRLGPRQRRRFGDRLKESYRDRRERDSSKVARAWPRRKDHKPPKPPNILTLTDEQKVKIIGQKQRVA